MRLRRAFFFVFTVSSSIFAASTIPEPPYASFVQVKAQLAFIDCLDEVQELVKGNVPPNAEAVVEATFEAAKRGNTEAQYTMGVILFVGKAVPLNYDAAVGWLNQAAKNGHLKALRNLGTCYKRGYGVPIDLEKSVDCYMRAAKGGESDAQFNLGAAYLLGTGNKKGSQSRRRLAQEGCGSGEP